MLEIIDESLVVNPMKIVEEVPTVLKMLGYVEALALFPGSLPYKYKMRPLSLFFFAWESLGARLLESVLTCITTRSEINFHQNLPS